MQAGQQYHKDGEQVPQKDGQIKLHSGEAHREGHQFAKQHPASLRQKKRRIIWVQRRVQILLDGWQINGAILMAQMVAVEEHARRGERQ